MSLLRRPAIIVWLIGLLACAAAVTRTHVATDMSAFLPRAPEPGQRLLLDQLQHGVVSRLVLIALEGAAPDALARLSKAMAETLRHDPAFVLVQNGEATGLDEDRAFVWRNRYLLSPGVTPQRFTVDGLRQSLETDLRLLGSDLGLIVKAALPADPTGETLTLISRLAGEARGTKRDGVLMSADGTRAFLLAQTRAAGFDLDGQEAALNRVRAAFDQAAPPEAAGARLITSGPGTFAVRSRASMKDEVSHLSLLASGFVAAILLVAYRSPRILLLAFVPVISGALVGVAAVSLGFGFIHGITLGFGVTLIGEAVDYAIYLFTQTAPGSDARATMPRLWPIIRLGMLTSVVGFSAMLFSSFTGFAQLGLYTIAGLLVAAGATRFVLPLLLPRDFAGARASALEPVLLAAVRRGGRLRRPLAVAVLATALLPLLHAGSFWESEIQSMSPVPRADLQLDQQLRREMGSPDVRHIVIATAADADAALAASEALEARLTPLIAGGALTGIDAPSRYLPSRATQRAHQAALPDPSRLADDLRLAVADLPFQPDLFQPFLVDVAAARTAPLLDRASLQGTTLALRVDSLLVEREGHWLAMLPLSGVTDPAPIARAIDGLGGDVALLDLKRESDTLLAAYRHEAVLLSLIGSLAIAALLVAALRSWRRAAAVLAPLAGAVLLVTVALTLGAQKLSIFHLFGLLLVVAVGSNYALFFERQNLAADDAGRTVTSLVLANLCTVAGFGVLGVSRIPVLHELGTTVAAGTFLSLILSAVWTPRRPTRV
ncbi:MAG: MMPL family transporter [Alphaproteobacteria bacterium]|nr:MMPL family transporter [Alphaproteobacteria bacterium]